MRLQFQLMGIGFPGLFPSYSQELDNTFSIITNIGHSCEPEFQGQEDSRYKLTVYMTGKQTPSGLLRPPSPLRSSQVHLQCMIILEDYAKENCKNAQWNSWSDWSTCTRPCELCRCYRKRFIKLCFFFLFVSIISWCLTINRERTCDDSQRTDHGMNCEGSKATRIYCMEEECPDPWILYP